MASSSKDPAKLDAREDRITFWNLGRTVDELLDQLKTQSTDPKDWTPSSIAMTLQKQPHIAAMVSPARIHARDIQTYLYKRQKRQEENADRALMTGVNGKILTSKIVERVQSMVEMSATAELAHDHIQSLYLTLVGKAEEAAKKGDFSLVKQVKEMTPVVKSQLDMMLKAANFIKGDATLQNIIKAQTLVNRQTVIHGIKPETLPKIMVDVIRHLSCPKCSYTDWTLQESIAAVAKYQGSKAGRDILDAQESPIIDAEDYDQDDPDAEPWDKMSAKYFETGQWKETGNLLAPITKPKRKKRRRTRSPPRN